MQQVVVCKLHPRAAGVVNHQLILSEAVLAAIKGHARTACICSRTNVITIVLGAAEGTSRRRHHHPFPCIFSRPATIAGEALVPLSKYVLCCGLLALFSFPPLKAITSTYEAG